MKRTRVGKEPRRIQLKWETRKKKFKYARVSFESVSIIEVRLKKFWRLFREDAVLRWNELNYSSYFFYFFFFYSGYIVTMFVNELSN